VISDSVQLKATTLYDEAVENEIDDGQEKERSVIDMEALEKCWTICRELLADLSLPPEHRILLNYYMAAQRGDDLCTFYLRRALSTVEILEAVEGTVDPMREILEAQLNMVAEGKSLGVPFDRGVAQRLSFCQYSFVSCDSLFSAFFSQSTKYRAKSIADQDRFKCSPRSSAA
jgi:hypothetical protein